MHKDAVLYYRGLVGEKQVVAFPVDTTFMLIDRSLVKAITPAEAALKQKAEDDELDEIIPPTKANAFQTVGTEGYL